MRTSFTPLLAAVICLCMASFASARMVAVTVDDALSGRAAEIVTIYGAAPTTNTLPRLYFLEDALYFEHQCFPAATGRDVLRLGGPVDPAIFGLRPAIECVGLLQDVVNIGFGLSRAGRLEITGPNTLAVMRGDQEIMTLRLIN